MSVHNEIPCSLGTRLRVNRMPHDQRGVAWKPDMMGLSLKRCFCVVVTVLLALQLLVLVLRVPLHLVTSRQGFVLLHRHFWSTEPSVPFDLEVNNNVSGKGSRHSRVVPEQIRFQLKANSSYDKVSLGSQTHFLRGYNNKTKSVSTVPTPTFSELHLFNTAPTSSSFYHKNTKNVHSGVTGSAPTVATGAKVVIPLGQLTRGPSQREFLKPQLLHTSVEKRPTTPLVSQRPPSRRQIRQPRTGIKVYTMSLGILHKS